MERVHLSRLYLPKATVANTAVVWWGRIDDGRQVIPREEWTNLTEEQRRRVLDRAHLYTELHPKDITVTKSDLGGTTPGIPKLGDFTLNWPEILKDISAPEEEPKKEGFTWRRFFIYFTLTVLVTIIYRLVFK